MIEFSKDALISLTTIYKMAGSPESQSPGQWKRLRSTLGLIKDFAAKDDGVILMESTKGKGGDTKAHPFLADEYKRYLNKARIIQSKKEFKVQLFLCEELYNPSIEVVTPFGRIDILTSKEVIEVKHVTEWKSAIGQVLVYGLSYPAHAKRIHLFGTVSSSSKLLIEKSAKKLNVLVSWSVLPTFEDNRLRPNQARAIAYSQDYQGELPV